MTDRPGVVSPEFRRLMLLGLPLGIVMIAIGLFQVGGTGGTFIAGCGVFVLIYCAIVSLVISILLRRRSY